MTQFRPEPEEQNLLYDKPEIQLTYQPKHYEETEFC
jgi:hypothetical protein